ncbi:MAG: alcohol dehydrogenase catalytic domain-containing protein, partial [Rhodobiaceae bacterium]|nr:alcohol dehydrogenase catalytic domain-containing protein [Rhodobiaceae bacterium]
MRALECQTLGPPESLVLVDKPDPEPGPGEIRVRVAAAGLNFFDTLIVQGRYQVKPALPFSPGGEFVGVVEAVGEGVTAPRPG